MYKNYHKHDHYGNPWMADSITKPEDYCKRAIELGHDSVFTTNHGVTGYIFDWMELCKKYGLKMHYGTEAYYVPDRFAKDRSNRHLIIIAKNNDGVMQLNDIMTEAHTTGFYYRPRIDRELLFSLEPKDFIVTTACVAGIWQDTELILALHRKFGNNFFLEVQSHSMEMQVEANKRILALSKEANIPIIHANDTHYIYPEDLKYRNIFQLAKGMNFENEFENDMILDYPDEDEIFRRYEKQGVLSQREVRSALAATMVFDECEPITIINDDIKLPSVSEHPMDDLKSIIRNQWKIERQSIPRDQWQKYIDAIQFELDIVEKTNMANYFLIDYIVAKNGQEKYDGRITNTGRGSAPSFYITKLLGLTDIDRVSAPITLFPTRFMSTERILTSRSLPDIDLNTTDREPFIKATEDLLGKENCAWMLSWKPLQDSSAFRIYCKGIGMNIGEYDDVAKNIDLYKDDKKWNDIIKESQRFIGVIESVSESPCSMLLYDKPIRRELGIVRMSSDKKQSGKEKFCCVLDGKKCDKYKYLKNDYLTVTVWAIIRDVCKLVGIPIPTLKEFDKLLDEKTFDIYKNGLTSTINQADSDFATNCVSRYCPKSVSEMSAFVAIIRPGCASLLQDFIERKPYTTGLDELDEILVEGNHRMIYQELIMKYLIWLGIPESGTYDIIKKIAKKIFTEDELDTLQEKLKSSWMEKVGEEKGFIETWTVVKQAAKYSFNSSHSLSYAYDSLYCAYLKSHYPLEYYTVALNYYNSSSEKTTKLTNELKAFGIQLKPIRFRFSRANYSPSRSDNSIYKGIESVKDLNAKVGEELYELRDNHYDSFIDLLVDLSNKTSIKRNQTRILIELDYFNEFGESNNLLSQLELYDNLCGRSQIKKAELESFGLTTDDIKPYASKETEKTFMGVDFASFVKIASKRISVRPRKLSERVKSQANYLGYITIVGEEYGGMAAVVDVDTKYSPRLKLYSLKNGTIVDCKINKQMFNADKLQKGDIVRVISTKKKPKVRKNTTTGEWESIQGTNELWVTKYRRLPDL